MKYYSSTSQLKFKWDQVATGFWHRYPNPYSNHVLSEDTISRKLAKGGKLFTTRLITKTSKLPKWGERFMSGPSIVCIVEDSIVDLKKKTLTTYTRNIGFTKVLTVEEKCTYTQSSENNNWTQCDRQAWINSSMFGFAYALQTFGFERFRSHAGKSLKGFEHVLNAMYIPKVLPDQPKLAIQNSKEKLKTQAIKATELAKSKAAPVMAKYAGGTTAS